MEIEQMRIRMGEMAAEIERLHSVIDEANAQLPVTSIQVSQCYAHIVSHSVCNVKDGFYKVYTAPIPAQQSPILRDYEEILSGQRELVRELDVLLNGDGAAKRASLCDVVSQVAQIVREKGAPLLQQSPVMAIDERTNEFGEPEAVYLQLHDPDDGNEKSHGSNYRADGVSWCWHPINENDVRYIRADIVQQSPAVAVPAHWAIKNLGIADQFRNEAIACRIALGFKAEANDVSPSDLTKKIESLSMTEKPEFNGWYCAQCQCGVGPAEVTYHETHTVCGRYITDDEPPKSPRITEQDARAIGVSAFRYWMNNCDRTVDDWIEDEVSALLNKLNEKKS